MQIFLRILKETGIAIIVMALVVLAIWLLFNKQMPFLGQPIPDAIEYAEIDIKDYSIEGDIESETNPTQTYEATNAQLNGLQNDRYISTGLINPFSSSANAEPDVPSERVTISNTANGGNADTAGTESAETDSGVKSLE